MNESDLWLHFREILAGTTRGVLLLGAMTVPVWYFERRQGASASRYLNRHFAHDLAYMVFYRSGIFSLLGLAYLASGAKARFEYFHWDVLLGLPTFVAAVLSWILMDLVFYWVHRAQHAVPWLWQFHSVHHTTESMTLLTGFRVHPLENLWHNTVGVLPLVMLGVPPRVWVP